MTLYYIIGGPCTLFSEVEGYNAIGEECKQIFKRPCDPNCTVVNFDGDFHNAGQIGVGPPGCNPAMPLILSDVFNPNYYEFNMNYRCSQICIAANLYSCDQGCIDRCLKYCHLPNIPLAPVALFCT